MASLYYPIEYKGYEIYVTDWSNLTNEETAIETFRATTQMVVDLNKFELLEMVLYFDSIITKNVILELQKMAKISRPFNKRKAAVSDFSATRLFILSAINRFSTDRIEPFKVREQALDWLIR